MVQRDWRLEHRDELLRIKGLRGGTISEITEFLNDMEQAYNAIYAFDLRLSYWRGSRLYRRRIFGPDEWLGLDPSFLDGRLDFSDDPSQVLPEYRLQLTRVSIQSPGFWEFLGGLNPLQQMREYLRDRHERRKDREYRETAEKEKLKLENELLQREIIEKDTGILRDQIVILREIGLTDVEVRQVVWARLGKPLSQLGRHQDRGLIEGPED